MKAGWASTTVGAEFVTATGGTPPKNNQAFYGDFLPLVKPPELRDSEVCTAEDQLSKEGAGIVRIAPSNSILISCIGNLGKIGINRVPVAFNQQINAIFPDATKADPWFMFYQALSYSFKEQLESLASGTTIRIVNKSKFNSVRIVLPTLPEQRRIVATLDDAFEAIATAKANTEKNLQNARELFESQLASVFCARHADWIDTTIHDCIRFIDYRGKTPRKADNGLRLITAKNVKMGYLKDTPAEFVSPDIYDSWMTRGIPKKGDIIFTTEAPLANVAQLDTDEKVVFAQRVIVMQPNELMLNSTFAKYMLLSRPVQERIHAKGTGATVKGIKASLLKTIAIAFPRSLGEQDWLVAHFDLLWRRVEGLESFYQRKLAALDELKQSLLRQAFTGALKADVADTEVADVV